MSDRNGLRWPTKAGYGAASVGTSAVELLLQVYLLELYILAGLKPSWAGLAIAIAVVWDAASDPLMGLVSDRTPTSKRSNKRVPYILGGAVLLGVASSCLFAPPDSASQGALFGHLLFWYLLVNTAMTLIDVPHLALVNDLAGSEGDRASLFAWRIALGSVGLLLGIGAPTYLANVLGVNGIADTLIVRSQSGAILGWFAAASCVVTCLVAARALRGVTTSGGGEGSTVGDALKALRAGCRSHRFLWLLVGFAAIAIGRAFNASLALPFYKSTIGLSEDQVGLILLVLTVFIIAAAPVWVALSRRIGKALLFAWAAFALATLSAIVYPVMPVGVIWPALAVASAGGVLVASIALLESLFSDFVEDEKGGSSGDQSGAYYGIWRMLAKASRALGIGVSGLWLSAIGYQEGSIEQAAAVDRSIAWAFGPGVAVFLALGGWAIYRTRR